MTASGTGASLHVTVTVMLLSPAWPRCSGASCNRKQKYNAVYDKTSEAMTDISRYQLMTNDIYWFVIDREVKVVISTNHTSVNISINSLISVDISHSCTHLFCHTYVSFGRCNQTLSSVNTGLNSQRPTQGIGFRVLGLGFRV
jgi:hypothetical protein